MNKVFIYIFFFYHHQLSAVTLAVIPMPLLPCTVWGVRPYLHVLVSENKQDEAEDGSGSNEADQQRSKKLMRTGTFWGGKNNHRKKEKNDRR